jgi:hypothetical protein
MASALEGAAEDIEKVAVHTYWLALSEITSEPKE